MAIEVDDRTAPGSARHTVTLHLHVEEVPGLCLQFNADVPSLDPDVLAAAVMQMLAAASTPELVREAGKAIASGHVDAADRPDEPTN